MTEILGKVTRGQARSSYILVDIKSEQFQCRTQIKANRCGFKIERLKKGVVVGLRVYPGPAHAPNLISYKVITIYDEDIEHDRLLQECFLPGDTKIVYSEAGDDPWRVSREYGNANWKDFDFDKECSREMEDDAFVVFRLSTRYCDYERFPQLLQKAFGLDAVEAGAWAMKGQGRIIRCRQDQFINFLIWRGEYGMPNLWADLNARWAFEAGLATTDVTER